jgi:uncharacterized YccA/Bax inhibitor family protein
MPSGGLVIGGVSALFEAQFPALPPGRGLDQAPAWPCYWRLNPGSSGRPRISRWAVAATGGIALFYILTMVLGFFGIQMPLMYGNSWASIGFSVVVVIIAALNLVLDFDFIEQGAAQGAPKYMEWYGAFGLMVTLIWLYLEMLRLLAKLRSRE